MFERLPLIGGSYTARSVIANAQRCINLYPEKNPKDSITPLTHYQRPGLVPLLAAAPVQVGVRGIWRTSQGLGLCVIGANVYSITSDFNLIFLGQVSPRRTNLCSFVDNGVTGLLVDGSNLGWQIDLTTMLSPVAGFTFTQVVDSTGSFAGSTKVDIIDGFILFLTIGSNEWGCTFDNSITFNGLNFASKNNYPDPLASLIVTKHEILLIGQLKSEIWYDVGNAQFPFIELPGTSIEHGTVAPYSVANADIATYWLSQDLQGNGMVFRQRGYETRRISNHALEQSLENQYLADAIGFTYQVGGHVFYVLTFPTADITWVWDESIEDPLAGWHQEAYLDPDTGVLHRSRLSCVANLYGKIVGGDWENGMLYQLNPRVSTDTVAGRTAPFPCIRTFPQIGAATDPRTGQMSPIHGRRVTHGAFYADIEAGNATPNSLPKVGLRWSDDRGRTFGNTVLRSTGEQGQFTTAPDWRGLGTARNRIYELSYAVDGACALNGGWLDAQVLDN